MEVHAHTHTERKKWTHYLWEFLMLFFAVFCGFLAEYKLEQTIEHHKEKEYMELMVADLKKDTANINTMVAGNRILIRGLDSLLDMLSNQQTDKNYQRKLFIYSLMYTYWYMPIQFSELTLSQLKYNGGFRLIKKRDADSLLTLSKTKLEGRNAAEFSFYTRFMYWTVPLSWNRATFQQIKNSGSLRYFKNYQLLEKLIKYDALVNEIEGEFNNHQTRGNMLLKPINEIIEPGFHHDISKYRLLSLDTMSKETRENCFTVKTESLENKRGEIREMLNMIVVQQRNILFNEGRLQKAEELAIELISDLKNEYQLN